MCYTCFKFVRTASAPGTSLEIFANSDCTLVAVRELEQVAYDPELDCKNECLMHRRRAPAIH